MILSVLFFILLVVFPREALQGALDGLRICGTRVIPSLFPFFVLSRFIVLRMPPISWSGMKRLFGVSGNVLPALVLSFLGGYPLGVATLTAMYEQGRITKQDAEHAIVFCNNSGPGLFIGLLGGVVFQNTAAGIALYAIHMITALYCGALLSGDGSSVVLRPCARNRISLPNAVSDAVTGASSAMLQVCSYVILFSVLSGLLTSMPLFFRLPEEVRSLLMGSLEITGGLSGLKASSHSFIIAAALMGWGGLCVHIQAMTLWQRAGLKPRGYFMEKLLHALLSAGFASALCLESVLPVICFSLFLLLILILQRFIQKTGRKKKTSVV